LDDTRRFRSEDGDTWKSNLRRSSFNGTTGEYGQTEAAEPIEHHLKICEGSGIRAPTKEELG
jgi:hypothetical protein